ncbi:hypothetical protein GCM10027090_30670 [Sinomonas soli]
MRSVLSAAGTFDFSRPSVVGMGTPSALGRAARLSAIPDHLQCGADDAGRAPAVVRSPSGIPDTIAPSGHLGYKTHSGGDATHSPRRDRHSGRSLARRPFPTT